MQNFSQKIWKEERNHLVDLDYENYDWFQLAHYSVQLEGPLQAETPTLAEQI
jgi:hypothetical protein